jgi:hypothetical protein
MKVFVPMSDATLGDNGEVCQRLVPFNPSFLAEGQEIREGRKPSNWVSESDYDQVRERLYATPA